MKKASKITINSALLLGLSVLPQLSFSAAAPNSASPLVNPLTSTDAARERIDRTPDIIEPLKLPTLTHDINIKDAEKIEFKLSGVTFDGNKVISSRELSKVVAKHIGQTIHLKQLLDLIEEITVYYREQGYVLSQAYLPEQDIDKKGAKLTIGVVEGHVHDFKIVGKLLSPTTMYLIEQYAKEITKEKPLTQKTLERYSLLMHDLPGGHIQMVFGQSDDKHGAAEIDIIVDQTKFVGFSLNTNNRGTRAIGPEEHTAGISQFNGFYGSETSYSKTQSDNKELVLHIYRHRQPLNADGLVASFLATHSRTKPDFRNLPAISRSLLDTPGVSNTYLLELEYPWIRARQHSLVTKAKFNVIDSSSRILGQYLFREKHRTLQLETTYNWLDHFVLNTLAQTFLTVELTQGLNAFGAYIRPEKGLTTRPNVDEIFTKITGVLTRSQPLTNFLTLQLFGMGQFANDELISAEEFGYGGRILGLGYDPYQIAGDHGIGGKATLELHVPFGYIFNKLGVEPTGDPIDYVVSSLYDFVPNLYVFYDGARVWNIEHRKSFQKKHDSAISRGAGINGRFMKYFNFDAYIAKPMTRVSINENDRKPRYFFSVGIDYR